MKFRVLCAHALLVTAGLAVPLAAGAGAVAAQEGADRVRIVMVAEPDTLDACSIVFQVNGQVGRGNLVETLVEYDPVARQPMPRLATAWENVDPQTWRFTLRDGVRFSDGEPFDAQAVLFNLERIKSQEFACAGRTNIEPGYEVEAVAIDPLTVEFRSSAPSPILPLTLYDLGIVSPNTPTDRLSREPIGTGPYTLREWQAGTQIVLERNPDYWGDAPEVGEAVFMFRAESAVRAGMVQAGEADIALAISPQDLTNQQMDVSYPNADTVNLRLDSRMAPFDDVRVRRALSHAIDRDVIIEALLEGLARPAAQPVTETVNGFNADLVPHAYDPELARQLLDEARADGVEVDTQVRFIVRIGFFPGVEDVAEALNAMFNDVGLDTRIEMMERARQATLQLRPFADDLGPNAMMQMHSNARGDAQYSARFHYHSEGISSALYSPEMDELIETAEMAIDEERTAAFEEVFRFAHEDLVPNAMLFHMVSNVRISPRVNFVPSAMTDRHVPLEEISFAD